MLADDLAQAPSQAVPRHRTADPLRSDKPGAKSGWLHVLEHGENEQAAAVRFPLGFDARELR